MTTMSRSKNWPPNPTGTTFFLAGLAITIWEDDVGNVFAIEQAQAQKERVTGIGVALGDFHRFCKSVHRCASCSLSWAVLL